MAKLIYSAITSLDGYVADEDGNFDWAEPDEEVHTFCNGLERPIGTYLYGRRMYEVMVYWETAHTLADQPPFIRDFAQIWQAADKIVYSRTLERVTSARTRIERDFDPETVRQIRSKREPTSQWAVRTSQPRRSGQVWWTSAMCSSCPSWWEAANTFSPTMFAKSFNCWAIVLLATAWFISDTAPNSPTINADLTCHISASG